MHNVTLYGNPPYRVCVIHGGPGAVGEVAPVAKELADRYGVMEPYQSLYSIEELVSELHTQITLHAHSPVTLIGHSWGAWFSMIYAAAHPAMVKKLIMVSSGPFEESYARDIMHTRLQRLSAADKQLALDIMDQLEASHTAGSSLKCFGKLMSKADSYDPFEDEGNGEKDLELRQFQSIWAEASTLRATGRLLEYAERIQCQVIALHGDYDPHPYQGVLEPLSRVVKDFKFVLLERCGHTPWKERQSAQQFYRKLKEMIDV